MKILNIGNLNPAGYDGIIQFCREKLKKGTGAFLIPMNPIKVIKARSRPDFQEIIDRADWVFPDAWGIKWAASLLYGQDIPICPGYRVMLSLVEQAGKDNHSVYFLGTSTEILNIAERKLMSDYPKLRICGTHHGFFERSEEEGLFKKIALLQPKYVFVAIGEYKQEQVISRLRHVHPSAIYMGVGGSVDLIAGKQPKPPEWIRNNHLEWLYRLVRQPFRAPRFKALPIFVYLTMKEKWLKKGHRNT